MRVIIIGGGFGGLTLAKGLNRSPCEVLLIDKTNHHLFQPLLYQVATAALEPADIALPIREIFSDQENVKSIMGEVISIDRSRKSVLLETGEHFSYDHLIIAVGARHTYFGHPEWAQFAPGLKTIEDALTIRQRILIAFEKAERIRDLEEVRKLLNFVIIGGGPTGVEMAGAIAEIARKTLFKNFRNIKPEEAKVYLIEMAPQILPSYPEKLRLRAQRDLEKMGATVVTGKRVTNITEEGVFFEDHLIPSQTIMWAAGMQAPPLLKSLDTPLDPQGRVIVDPDLSIPGSPEVFVIGDSAHTKDSAGRPLPAVSPVAIQQGEYVARLIRYCIPKEKRRPFTYYDKGMIATIGKNHAVAKVGSLQLTGILAWLAWCFIHILYLISYRSRIAVMLEWFILYFTGHRGARLIYR